VDLSTKYVYRWQELMMLAARWWWCWRHGTLCCRWTMSSAEMFRNCRMKLLLAAAIAFQATVLVVVTLIRQESYSADFRQSLTDDNSMNETLALDTFLVEYEKYCNSQAIAETSSVAVGSVVSNNPCRCVPDTLGKWLYLVWVIWMNYFVHWQLQWVTGVCVA